MAPGKFEIVTTRMGALSIRDNVSLEIMHNPVGPWLEANSLYISQSNLEERLQLELERELVIFDVGLGAAANALATLHCARGLAKRRPLRLVSFERDLELLQFALENAHHFEHFKGYESAVRAVLEKGEWKEDGIHWELRHGDFLELIGHEQQRADIIFYDPYSFKKNPEMWLPEVFKKVRSKCSDDGILYTYSRGTPIRIGLLMAGFFIGRGKSSGPKDETTQASVRLKSLAHPLGKEWLEKWQRSHKQYVMGSGEESVATVKEFIFGHPQFNPEGI